MYTVYHVQSTSGLSNIRPAGHNPARQAFLSGPRGLPNSSKFNRHLPLPMVNLCCRNVKNDRFVSIRYVFEALKYAKTRFLPGLWPGPRWGSLWHSPIPPSRLVASRSRRPSVVWPRLVWNLYIWSSSQKGWTWTPLMYIVHAGLCTKVIIKKQYPVSHIFSQMTITDTWYGSQLRSPSFWTTFTTSTAAAAAAALALALAAVLAIILSLVVYCHTVQSNEVTVIELFWPFQQYAKSSHLTLLRLKKYFQSFITEYLASGHHKSAHSACQLLSTHQLLSAF